MTTARWSPFLGEPAALDPAPESTAPSRLPFWFWLLPLVAIAAWWPLDCYWKSDDFLAVGYVQDFGNVLHDFHGAQYGATDIWWFLRPLITLSFWLDTQIGGAAPFASHLSNVLAHGVSALLVGLLWTRALPQRLAFAAGLLWAVLPSHAGSISWAVGRVDSHTTVWCLMCLWLTCRGIEGHRTSRWLALLALLLALLSKESAFALAPLVLLLGVALAPAKGLWSRLRRGLGVSWPHFAVFAVYLGYRYWVLGRFGGYAAASLQPADMAQGLGRVVLDLLDPQRWSGAETAARWLGSTPAWLVWVGYLPAAAAVPAFLMRRGLAALATTVVLFLVAAAPMAPFWSSGGNVQTLRYYYLPMAALCGVLAAGGPALVLAALLLWACAFVDVRTDYLRADREDAAMHRMLLREVDMSSTTPLFVAGLPHANRNGTVVQLHYFVDRLLAPPFTATTRRLLALRPAAEVPGVFRLTPPDELPFALPGGTTRFFRGHDLFGRATTEQLPTLPIDGEPLVDLSTPRLQQLASHELRIALRTPGVRPELYRLTIFTATGYLCAVVPDFAAADAADGSIDMLRFLGGDRAVGITPPQFDGARFARGGNTFVLRGLEVPVTIDLVPEFPVLLEGGTDRDGTFVPTHRADHLLTFRFDRDFPAFVRAALQL